MSLVNILASFQFFIAFDTKFLLLVGKNKK